MTIRDWDIVTSYVDSVTTTLKTVTFPKVQESVKVKNQGNADLTYTIGTQSGTLTPGQSVKVTESISSFTLQAALGVQSFELRAVEQGTEKTEDTSTDLFAQLAEKANQSDVTVKADKSYVDTQIGNIGNASPKGTYANLSALQTAFPIGTTGIYLVTADGKWYYWNGSAWTAGGIYQATGLADGIVTAQKTDFMTQSANKFNKDTAIQGGYMNFDGTVATSAAWAYSDFIPIENSKTYRVNNGVSNIGAILYNSSKQYLDTVWIDTTPATTSFQARTFTINNANAKYMIVNISVAGLSNGMVTEGASVPPAYIPYGVAYLLGKEVANKPYVDSVLSKQINISDYARDQVAYGCQPDYSGTLTSSISAGVIYIGGKSLNIASVSHTYTANTDTFIDIDNTGTYYFTEVSNGGAIPALVSGRLRIAKVISGATNIPTLVLYNSNVYIGGSDSFAKGRQRYNAVLGYNALSIGGNTQYATAIGYGAMQKNQPDGTQDAGLYNTAVGAMALQNNTIGNHNTSVGFQASNGNTTGSSNTSLGEDALFLETTGGGNTALGNRAMQNSTGSQNNTAVGLSSMYYGTSSNVTGSENTAVGHYSGSSVTSDINCTFIGSGANKDTTANSYTNSSAIGANAQVSKSNQIMLGNSGVTEVDTYADLQCLTNGKGLILRSPSGNKFKLTISDAGALTITSVS